MNTLLLNDAQCASKFAPLLLDKAIKRSLLLPEDKRPTTLILPKDLGATQPQRAYELTSMAAMHGLLTEEGSVEPTPSEFIIEVSNERIDLRYDADEALCDWHAHTQFAYCARGIDFETAAAFSLALGVQMQGFSEHAFALYFPSNALKFYWQSDPDFVHRIWQTPMRGRMAAYRALLAKIPANDQLRFGLEVDLFGGGELCLAPADVGHFDYLIGAIHEIEGISSKSTQAEVESAWMRDLERLLSYPIKILAHPFRYFPWYHRATPTAFYNRVAKMLAKAGIAAEINHHQNPFDLEFFRACLDEGVKLSLGTDAHITRNIADLWPHFDTLNALGLDTPALRKAHLLTTLDKPVAQPKA